MDARLNVFGDPTAGKFLKHIISAGQVVKDSSLPASTQELMALRASQINGCGFCTDMHTKDALAAGETSTPGLGLSSRPAGRPVGRRRLQ